ncbi:MAG: isocitrate dehydrogenase (NADP(+)) [Deltaproteobacteria bacterium HGW-Deltaproteobacteria-21]|nr:MAG: isocitrate dehydrogenase (NADP(+)) [Deltaproteobacteria bacterium HGW-Deltaproteobacteria-21]
MENGEKILFENGKLKVPDRPIIPFIEGDGTGPDIWRAAVRVMDKAVEICWGGKRKIIWKEVLAGEKAFRKTGSWLPDETIKAFQEHRLGIKGPLTTPVGGGIRSLNVALRQKLDLYACVRPVRYFDDVPSPVKNPHRVNMVVFRENTEDVYAGLELEAGSDKVKTLLSYLEESFGWHIRPDSGVGIKPISRTGSRRLIRAAIDFAVSRKRKSVTLVHKGNIQKFTEGAFRRWGYELAREEYPDLTVPWDQVKESSGDSRIIIQDVIADNFFQQALLRPEQFDVIATTNLNGDYMSDALAAQVGGIGMAPGGNINYQEGYALFEATHGTAPKYAGMDKVNPSSVILSGAMMLDYMGWHEAAKAIESGIGKAITSRKVTYDLARLMKGAEEVSCSRFADLICANMPGE